MEGVSWCSEPEESHIYPFYIIIIIIKRVVWDSHRYLDNLSSPILDGLRRNKVENSAAKKLGSAAFFYDLCNYKSFNIIKDKSLKFLYHINDNRKVSFIIDIYAKDLLIEQII